ncbi:hypothetical protein VE02_05892 [Pseudogymnoascus sp. 03VT05]|nr:hypothetical protein VE02_05892 [Pseudogymnoascus sp. 03VT05]
MADHDGDFNSSDIEIDEIEDPLANLGARSIDAIIESAFADRIASKRSSKLLKYTKGAPGTVTTNATWMNRFVAFQVNTLKVELVDPSIFHPQIDGAHSNPTMPPTGRHLERFFTIVPSKVQTYSPHGKPSLVWIKHGVSSLIGGLIFKHETFRLSSHGRSRLSTTIDKLLKDGVITAKPARVAQWVTAALVIRLCDSYLLDALNNGTKSWSITLSRLLSMVLMAACASRAGEIGRSAKYVKMECLCFKDVDIRFNEHGDMIAHIVLRFQKKERHKQISDRRTVEVRNLNDPKHNPVCPLKLLLVHGVRQQGRSRGAIVWKAELLELPVICAIDGPGKSLLYDKPASALQILNTVKQARLHAGIITSIVPHDIRRGSTKDFVTLPGAAKGVATAKTAVQVGHSAMSSTKGLTQKYAGNLEEDHWGPRLAASKISLFGPQLADQPIKIARLRTDDVVSECEKRGVNPNDVNARATIRR